MLAEQDIFCILKVAEERVGSGSELAPKSNSSSTLPGTMLILSEDLSWNF
jgi:hypothetical protein